MQASMITRVSGTNAGFFMPICHVATTLPSWGRSNKKALPKKRLFAYPPHVPLNVPVGSTPPVSGVLLPVLMRGNPTVTPHRDRFYTNKKRYPYSSVFSIDQPMFTVSCPGCYSPPQSEECCQNKRTVRQNLYKQKHHPFQDGAFVRVLTSAIGLSPPTGNVSRVGTVQRR